MEHDLHLSANEIGEGGAAPRYGTWTKSTPATILNSSPATWTEVPMPAEPMLILPGLAFAYATNSGTVLAGKDGLTTITLAPRWILATGTMSRMKLNVSLL